MTPTFIWSGPTPEASGTATFKAAGLTHSMPFPSFADAQLMHELLKRAYDDGMSNGRRAVAQLVTGAVGSYR